MSHPKNKYFADRVLTINDERDRVVILSDFNLELPTVDVFDEPLRCYKINEEWAKIITGAVDLLCEVAVWKDAQNEGYIGIQKILAFLRGEDCMDCNDVENCLTTSPIIAAINALIATNAAASASNALGIISNDADILALQNADITHANDILALFAENDAQDALIATNAAASASNTLGIISNDGELADHETRITTLENAPGGGGGGGGIAQLAMIEQLIETHVVAIAGSKIDFSVPAGFDSLRLTVAGIRDTITNKQVQLKYNDDDTQANYRYTLIGGTGANTAEAFYLPNLNADDEPAYSDITIRIPDIQKIQRQMAWIEAAARYGDAGGGVFQIRSHMWQNNDLVTKITLEMTGAFKFVAGSTVRLFGTKEMEILLPSGALPANYLVTFDAGGYAFTFADVGATSLAVQSGGNPNNCLVGTGIAIGEYFEVIIDMGEVRDIVNVSADFWTSNKDNAAYAIYVDGSPIVSASEALSNLTQGWENFELADWTNPDPTPTSGQIVKVRIAGGLGSFAEARLDNILIETA